MNEKIFGIRLTKDTAFKPAVSLSEWKRIEAEKEEARKKRIDAMNYKNKKGE